MAIRWGIIGCGDVTEVKSGPGFAKANGSALLAVMRRDGAKAADYAKRHGVPRWYDDGSKLIADPDVDAVYVATPPGAHLDGARHRNLQHVVLEARNDRDAFSGERRTER